ncbi:MAG: serine--tRNA ligase [Haliscomenobacteraceae bacterium CHB4]|nr:Serine--tRNA ligase [Saprospiraceae bacterium]MCE7925478.1 serine--tRNA ligase [Haliscomenobacteraceae bacterium CHB4]
MLQVKVIREEKQRIVNGLRKRNWSAQQLKVIDRILKTDDERRATQKELDDALAESNRLSKQIGALMGQGKKDEAEALKNQVTVLKTKSKELEEHMDQLKNLLDEMLYTVPNCPHKSVPKGKTPEDNKVAKDWKKPFPALPDDALPHWELAKKYNLFDLELGVKLTGAGFPVYRGKGARLQRALIQFFLDEAVKAGYEEILPPHLVNEDTARGTGQLPDKEAQMYKCELDNLYLIPTAEVPVTNILRDEIVPVKDLPIKMTAYTPCFRREAGSYGAHVRGLNRVHQFDKVEIVQIEHPERSYQTLQAMVRHVEKLMNKLELPFRILLLCGGDMGFASAKTYDFEVWSAAQKRWLEVSSVSCFESFQSNRMKLRFRDADGKIELAHTLNGSALALARIVAAILENNQTPEGILIPKVLWKYTGFKRID